MTRLTIKEYRILTGQQKSEESKQPRIRSTKTTVDGITFDSKREAERYLELKMAQKAGHISKLRRQVPFSLSVNRIHVCVYRADFVYIDREGNEIVEDAKGHRTEVYLIKKKLMAACHGIEVKES
jgi:hypothetical protein